LFKALFPHLPLDELQPGETEEEVADNLRTLRGLLGESILETDLSYISATAIMSGDLTHLAEFLQILMQVIALLAEGEGEGDDIQGSHIESHETLEDHKLESEDENKSDTQKIKAGLGLSSPEGEGEYDDDEEYQYEDQMMNQIDQDDHLYNNEPIIEDEPVRQFSQPSPPFHDSPESQSDISMKPESNKRQKVDVLNDPLLPEDADMRQSSGKKRKKAGSIGDNDREDRFDNDEEEDEAIVFDELPPDEKLAVIQQLYEEYNRDPDSFPEEQRILLEEELKNMIDQGLIDGVEGEGEGEEDESELDDRMKAEGEINFPNEPLPVKKEDDERVISKGDKELDIEEIDMKKADMQYDEDDGNLTRIYSIDHNGQYDHDEHYEHDERDYSDSESNKGPPPQEEPDEEAQIISPGKVVRQPKDNRVPRREIVQAEGTETPELDDEMKLAMFHRMQREQAAISRRITRRKKSKTKKKKKPRPETAKYTTGMMNRSRYDRPWTANTTRTVKKKKKTKKRNPQDLYIEQLRQQQMLQQLALEQQNLNHQEEQEQPEGEGDIQITPEQALLLYQQLAERQQSGEELLEEELEQLQFLGQLLEQNFAAQNQQTYDVDDQAVSHPVRNKPKRKKSKKKSKIKGKKQKQKVDERTLQMMFQNQQNQQNMQRNQNMQNTYHRPNN
jgi:hypothetical protein